jgi:hypothetical protein
MVTVIDKWSETITVEEAYRAVQELVLIYWETGGRSEDEIANFGSALNGDPALEEDWLAAVAKVRS